MNTIEDVADLLRSIVCEQLSLILRCLELFKMFHSFEAGDTDARIDKTHQLYKKINGKIEICKIESMRHKQI